MGEASPPPGPQLRLEQRGVSVAVDLMISSGTVVGVTVRVGAASVLPVQLSNETDLDRLGKALGISREVQLDDPDFDPRVYIETDDVPDEAVRALLAAPAARQAAASLLEQLGRVPLGNVYLGAEGVLVHVLDSAERPAFEVGRLRTVLDLVAALAAALPQGSAPTPAVEKKEPYDVTQVGGGYVVTFNARWVQVGVWIWVGFLVVAWITAVLSLDYYRPVHRLEQLLYAGGAALVAWLPSLVPIALVVRGKASSFGLFVVLATLGAVGLCPAGAAAFVQVNALADQSPTVVHQATIVAAERYQREHDDDGLEIEVQPFGASGGTYTFEIRGWPPPPGLTVGEKYPVEVRAGALGSAYFVPR